MAQIGVSMRPTVGRILRGAAQRRTFGGRSSRVADWRNPVGGAAPRLGPRQYIGHDVAGRGAWKDRDPLSTPQWWDGARWAALIGWAALTAGSGYVAWRRHGGKAFLFGEADD